MLALAAPLLSSSNWRCVLVSYTRINVPWKTAEILTQLYMYMHILYMYTVHCASTCTSNIHVHTCTYERITCMSSAAKGQGTMYESSCTYTGRLFMYMHAYVYTCSWHKCVTQLLKYPFLETMTYWDAWQLAGKCFYSEQLWCTQSVLLPQQALWGRQALWVGRVMVQQTGSHYLTQDYTLPPSTASTYNIQSLRQGKAGQLCLKKSCLRRDSNLWCSAC